MNLGMVWLAIGTVLLIADAAYAAEVKLYPGAVIDENATNYLRGVTQKTADPSVVTVYVSKDPFEKVVTFYRELREDLKANSPRTQSDREKTIEDVMRRHDKKSDEDIVNEGPAVTLPGGQRMASRAVYVILDNVPMLGLSKLYVQILHPFFLYEDLHGENPRIFDVRDATGIWLINVP